MPPKLSATKTRSTIEWPTILLLVVCYGSWSFSAFWLYEASPLFGMIVLAVSIALHSSLQHEVLHGHPTRNRAVNESLVFLPLGLAYPYQRFRDLHLKHHNDERLTDPYDDPESFYRAAFEFDELPNALKLLLRMNNTLLGRLITGPALMVAGFVRADLRKIANGNKKVRDAWILHGFGILTVSTVLSFSVIPIWAYVLSAYSGLSLIAIRTYAEHQWSERPDGRTIIVESSPLALLFLNNNLHLVHHKHPTVAWYDLPDLYQARREEWEAMNDGYVFRNYFSLFRSFAFRAKEPVCHPVLRRRAENGRTLHPIAMRTNGSPEVVPSEAPKK